jgi:hypothetical protein
VKNQFKREPKQLKMSENPYLSSSRQGIWKKIEAARETGREPPVKQEGELNCCECHGWGILRLTRKEGPYEWLTCDFCGWVEPIVKVTGTIGNFSTVMKAPKLETW